MTENWSKSNYLSKFSRKFIINLQKQTLLLLLLLLTSRWLLKFQITWSKSAMLTILGSSWATAISIRNWHLIVLLHSCGESILLTSLWFAKGATKCNFTTNRLLSSKTCLFGAFPFRRGGNTPPRVPSIREPVHSTSFTCIICSMVKFMSTQGLRCLRM